MATMTAYWTTSVSMIMLSRKLRLYMQLPTAQVFLTSRLCHRLTYTPMSKSTSTTLLSLPIAGLMSNSGHNLHRIVMKAKLWQEPKVRGQYSASSTKRALFKQQTRERYLNSISANRSLKTTMVSLVNISILAGIRMPLFSTSL